MMTKLKFVLAYLCVFVWGTSHAEPNYVTTCAIYGQFGSQLFSVAMVYGLAWEYGLHPYVPRRAFLTAPGGQYNYEHFFSQFIREMPQNLSIEKALHIHYSQLTPITYSGGSICLCGLRTELWYFQRFKQEIRNLFAPSSDILNALNQKYSFIIEHPKTVAVHIRTYHPYLCPDHVFLGEVYYKNAIDHFPDDCLFVIFSDRIEWCKRHLNSYKKNMIFIEGNDHLHDFFLMTRCKNIITANSTYSWWAAFLLANERGRILAPSRWFYDSFNTPNNDILNRRLYPDDWEILSVTYLPPPDIELLTHTTTSIDENK